ncbi:MAG: tetratricopeptide repeat protein [Bacteroidia bacterium]|nr:tetratricopeptide repeat protein [Bacteroidia bacterium]MDW8236671.1 tetratricopeptide repeat protein [Bacteroidia bacterium]
MQSEQSSEISQAEKTGWASLWQKFKENRWISIGGGALLIGVVGWIAYRQYQALQNSECLREMRFAETYFRQDSFEKAVKGTATAMGFEQLVEEYGSTPAGNLCRLYLGLCYLKLGRYEAAKEALSAYDAPDTYLGGAAWAALAGAYAELKEFEEAGRCYEKAARVHRNTQTSPIYLLQGALTYELAQRFDKAKALYEEIIERYPTSSEASAAQKHLARLQTAHED